jgi:5-methylcytosine-specific restriction endonuclease McrA
MSDASPAARLLVSGMRDADRSFIRALSRASAHPVRRAEDARGAAAVESGAAGEQQVLPSPALAASPGHRVAPPAAVRGMPAPGAGHGRDPRRSHHSLSRAAGLGADAEQPAAAVPCVSCEDWRTVCGKMSEPGKVVKTLPGSNHSSTWIRGTTPWLILSILAFQENARRVERKSHLVKKERRENLFFRRKKFYEIEFKQCQSCGAGFVDRSAKLNVQLCRCCKYKNSSEQVRAINLSKSVDRGRSRACKSCGVLFSPLYGFGKELRSTCSDECNKLDKKKYKEEYKKTEVYKSIRARNRHIRRIRKRNNSSGACAVDKFTRIEIFERDKWVCKLCGKKVDKSLKHNQLMSATLDHIFPIADGGSHTRANVQLAHMICNSNKGRGSIKHEQLLLIG